MVWNLFTFNLEISFYTSWKPPVISNSWPICWLVSSSPPKKLSKILLRLRSSSFAPIWRSHGPGNRSSSIRRLKIETLHLISILELCSGYRNIMNLNDWKVFISSLRKFAENINIPKIINLPSPTSSGDFFTFLSGRRWGQINSLGNAYRSSLK